MTDPRTFGKTTWLQHMKHKEEMMRPIDQYECEMPDTTETKPSRLNLDDLTGEDVQLALDIRDRRIKELELIIEDLRVKNNSLASQLVHSVPTNILDRLLDRTKL